MREYAMGAIFLKVQNGRSAAPGEAKDQLERGAEGNTTTEAATRKYQPDRAGARARRRRHQGNAGSSEPTSLGALGKKESGRMACKARARRPRSAQDVQAPVTVWPGLQRTHDPGEDESTVTVRGCSLVFTACAAPKERHVRRAVIDDRRRHAQMPVPPGVRRDLRLVRRLRTEREVGLSCRLNG
jgi:hypothetical protein